MKKLLLRENELLNDIDSSVVHKKILLHGDSRIWRLGKLQPVKG